MGNDADGSKEGGLEQKMVSQMRGGLKVKVYLDRAKTICPLRFLVSAEFHATKFFSSEQPVRGQFRLGFTKE